jgi:hypothetical protein
VTFVNPIEGASVLPPPSGDFTNGLRGFQRNEPPPGETNSTNVAELATNNPAFTNSADLTTNNLPASNTVAENATNSPPTAAPRRVGPRRPPWLRRMSDADYSALIARRELHGLVLTMSTENFQAISTRDLWLRGVIILFRGHFRCSASDWRGATP